MKIGPPDNVSSLASFFATFKPLPFDREGAFNVSPLETSKGEFLRGLNVVSEFSPY